MQRQQTWEEVQRAGAIAESFQAIYITYNSSTATRPVSYEQNMLPQAEAAL
jgi:hypothetical protein